MTRGFLGSDRVALVASRVRREEKALLAALERRVDTVAVIDARTVQVEVGGAAPGFDVVVNREIAWTRARYLADAWESAGVRVLNPARTTTVCGNKWATAQALRTAGVPTPATRLALTPEAALDAADELGYPVVVKPLVGSWGRLVAVLRDPIVASTVLDHVAALPAPEAHIVLLQQFVDKPGRDIRVLVAGGRAVAASYRYSEADRTNVGRGGRVEPCPLDDALARLAVAAAAAVAADLAGVDIVEGPDGERLVLEVNDRVEFAGLQGVVDLDLGEQIIAHLDDAPRAVS
ncbi:[lysine-biosynthesis-protein LysW]---L-2-aminoadipate ligase [Jatrophihabitans endophyticus]|uniref:[lysine-biosynthesis-protein LysW]---L-2-aminoadipate ligase n=1 Tax=Jatrophihabitans endophyticus TaxID=1206085 RepID=A0A1M5CRV1_9ACTN|nr:RimK family alpha-L-glutamate ligase [Jatrophihabitans endophyticus]SHF57052.1 [lysine-biosynthesis-protein LysW]---L-2-aminoadipate ligase [Jatrophihabitans endophyticus]